MSTIIHQKVEACKNGTYPYLIKKLNSGYLVAGETQPVEGYCLILADPVVPSLNHMEKKHRERFLNEMAEVGDLILEATQALRINYEMLGNVAPALHAHLLPRYLNEQEKLMSSVFCVYDFNKSPAFNPDMNWFKKFQSLIL